MSYILNALRKSEQERHGSQEETLEHRIQNKQQNKAKKTSSWLIVLVIVNLFFLLYFFWSFTNEKSAGENAEQLIPVKPQITIDIVEPIVVKKPISPDPDPVVVSVPKLNHPQVSIAEQIKNKKRKSKPVKAIKSAKIKQVTQTVIEAVKPIKPLISVLKQQNKVALAKVEKQQDDLPFLSSLDYDFRRQVPNIDINVYVYADKQKDRFIMINMKKYLSGEQIASNMLLKEIRINSIVVEYNNKVFQIKRH